MIKKNCRLYSQPQGCCRDLPKQTLGTNWRWGYNFNTRPKIKDKSVSIGTITKKNTKNHRSFPLIFLQDLLTHQKELAKENHASSSSLILSFWSHTQSRVAAVSIPQTRCLNAFFKEEIDHFFKNCIYLFYISTTVSPPPSPLSPSSLLPLCPSLINSSVSIHKMLGLQWISTKCGISGCSKTECLPSFYGWERWPNMRSRVPKVSKSFKDSACSYF